MPRITLGTVLMFVAIGTTIVTALLGAPDWLTVVVAALLFVLALVLPIVRRRRLRFLLRKLGWRRLVGRPPGPLRDVDEWLVHSPHLLTATWLYGPDADEWPGTSEVRVRLSPGQAGGTEDRRHES
ncbi:hypothetical protein [Gordonia hongkongensis]|uniref:hypothetical protein n=1 Tax=Gordonia hongkongensis TaxID=1701090 RepID=UPI001FFA2237|nr:hypothetical protein [Gordonia hongkongensis]UPG66518.1 hypothetical protein MVF96_13425 [Gordonia hongkongensis]